jgi:hypothetical protein
MMKHRYAQLMILVVSKLSDSRRCRSAERGWQIARRGQQRTLESDFEHLGAPAPGKHMLLQNRKRNIVNLQFQPALPGRADRQLEPDHPAGISSDELDAVCEQERQSSPRYRVWAILATLISPSPKLQGLWLLGAGTSFIFSTASNSRLGQNKWRIGPAGVFGYWGGMAGWRVSSAMVFDGWAGLADHQPDEYSILLRLPSRRRMGHWYVSEHARQRVREQKRQYDTFRLGLNVSKVIKIRPLRVKLQIQGQYMPVHPDVFGQKSAIRSHASHPEVDSWISHRKLKRHNQLELACN